MQVPLLINLRHRVDAESRLRATSQAEVTAVNVSPLLGAGDRAALRSLVATAAASARTHVLVVNPAGHVIADSDAGRALGRDDARRPEVVAALRGRRYEGAARREGDEVRLASAPVLRRGAPAGAVVVSEDVEGVRGALRRTLIGLAILGAIVLVVGLGAGAVIAAQVARPLRRLDAAARRIADGDLDVRAPVEGTAEQRSLARSFNDMTDRLSRALISQRHFVADASHQLRTPLAGLQLRLEEAEAAGMTAEAADQVAAGMRELDRLSHTVDELLVLSRAGERDAPGEEVDLGEQAALAADRWRARVADRGMTLVLRAPEAAAPAWAAPADVQRAVDVLIENAVQYAPPGTTIALGVDGQAIEVLDEGPGLADDEVEAVFERFRRGRAGKARVQGSGLGLPIARELARRWQGDATLENRPGGGARAAVTLPPFAKA